MNVELLKRVADAIVANPHDFDMGEWFQETENTHVVDKSSSCGTTACIGGWAIALHLESPVKGMCNSFDNREYCSALGLSWGESATRLLYSYLWPEYFEKRYEFAETDEERAQVAYDRIYHFIATDGAE